MICRRCGEPIRDGEPHDRLDNPGDSRGCCTVYLHRAQCQGTYTRTYPEVRR